MERRVADLERLADRKSRFSDDATLSDEGSAPRRGQTGLLQGISDHRFNSDRRPGRRHQSDFLGELGAHAARHADGTRSDPRTTTGSRRPATGSQTADAGARLIEPEHTERQLRPAPEGLAGG